MNREILFRGRQAAINTDKDEYVYKWEYGYYAVINNNAHIYSKYENSEYDNIVDPKTIGQFIGRLDTDEGLLFEGDVVEYGDDGKKERAKITYSEHTASFRLEKLTGYKSAMDIPFHIWNGLGALTRIGNIHDNPELED